MKETAKKHIVLNFNFTNYRIFILIKVNQKYAKNEYFIASDLHAILSYTNKFITLEDGDIAILTKNTIKIIKLL